MRSQNIATALPQGPESVLRAIASFECNLQKVKHTGRAHELLRGLKQNLLPELEYASITAHYAAERATLIELFNRASTACTARASAS